MVINKREFFLTSQLCCIEL